MSTLKIKTVRKGATAPYRQVGGNPEFELYAGEDITINPGSIEDVKLGVDMTVPLGTKALVWAKARHALKGLCVPVSCRWIQYIRGASDKHENECAVSINNCSDKPRTIKKGEAFAQMLIYRPTATTWEICEDLTQPEV